MTFREPLKPDHRPKRLGWAPGDYFCMCAQCGAHYLGDKRSWTCAPCAYAEAETAADASEGDLTRDGWSEELTIQTDGSPCGTYLHIGDMIGRGGCRPPSPTVTS